MTLAQKSGALSWRLRAATDLARSWSRASRAENAHDLLSPIYSEFKEGLETPDLVAAGQLLASLTRGPER
jgi:predicted ATPase